jgi:adenine-specific DNA-methyltransferase
MNCTINHHTFENPDYLRRQLITYIGNKRALLGYIACEVDKVKRRLGKAKLKIADLFSGSGVVSRFFKSHASLVISNDIEDYAAAISRCYLRNKSEIDIKIINNIVEDFNKRVDFEPFAKGFIEEMYSPEDEENIKIEDRVFYTRSNARRIDNYRRLISGLPSNLQDLLLGPLLSEASIHANTSGVFKGFYKNRLTGIGQFGGSGRDALSRILGEITLEAPILSNFECDYLVYQEDANELAKKLKNIDLVYLDPPYNQHPYGSNYFMLNLITTYRQPERVSRVSGIPVDWRRSGYNVKSKSLALLEDLVYSIDENFVLISFNNEGFISLEKMTNMLSNIGKLDLTEIRYNAFKGSRNLYNRSIYVNEYLFLLEKR